MLITNTRASPRRLIAGRTEYIRTDGIPVISIFLWQVRTPFFLVAGLSTNIYYTIFLHSFFCSCSKEWSANTFAMTKIGDSKDCKSASETCEKTAHDSRISVQMAAPAPGLVRPCRIAEQILRKDPLGRLSPLLLIYIFLALEVVMHKISNNFL